MATFRKKPVVIEAVLWHPALTNGNPPDWLSAAIASGKVYYQGGDAPYLTIETLEGSHRADVGDWVIQGVKGELYPCKPDIFAMTYEVADTPAQADGNSRVTALSRFIGALRAQPFGVVEMRIGAAYARSIIDDYERLARGQVTFQGVPVVFDESMAPGEIRVDAGGCAPPVMAGERAGGGQ